MVQMEIVTDPVEIAKAREQRARFERNWAWFATLSPEFFDGYRGKHLCVAGQQLFAADSPEEALAQAKAAHPDDNGRFMYYVSKNRFPKIYAHRW